jgi:predicted DNA-binding protein with PD1-like motif
MIQFVASPARAGRMLVGRLLPGSDLIGGLEGACDAHRVRFAAIVSCYGSLSAAGFKVLQIPADQERPQLTMQRVEVRVEFMGGQGLICENPDGDRETHLHGSISDARGIVSGGHFVPGENPVFNNMDFVLQELLDIRLIREHDPLTDTVEMRVEGSAGT